MNGFPSSRFPWKNAMAIGMGVLRLPPDTFWRMTLPELSAAAGVFTKAGDGMSRRDLRELSVLFPDEGEA